MTTSESLARVGVVMGSRSDWETMRHATETLDELGVTYEVRVLSAHRTLDQTLEYAASAQQRGLKVLIAGAGGAAHLAGVLAAKTQVPVLGVPIHGGPLGGLDALLSMVQMPGGVPVGTFAIGKAGAVNAALFAGEILALGDANLAATLERFRVQQTGAVLACPDPRAT